MTVTTPGEVRNARTAPLPLVFRLAARELRSGLSGFYVFIACVALGVMVITGVGALSDALKSGFEKQGALLLGGDVTVSRPHTRATVDERRWIDGFGRSSETATMRTMGRNDRWRRSDADRVEGRGWGLSTRRSRDAGDR